LIYQRIFHHQEQYFIGLIPGKKMECGKKYYKHYGVFQETLGKKKTIPTLLIADSQAVKNTGSAHQKGFCNYKCTNGIKRHLLTDVLGCPPMIEITTANISDDQGFVNLITTYIKYFKEKPVNTKKITILLDNGYHPLKIMEKLKIIYPQISTKITLKVTPKPLKDKENPGFKPVHKRWIVEVANSISDKCRVLWKNCEKYLDTSKCKVQICFIRVMLLRLRPA
jgi:Transposase DDE domain